MPIFQDQPALRQVIYGSDLRIATMTGEYNFRLGCPGYENRDQNYSWQVDIQ